MANGGRKIELHEREMRALKAACVAVIELRAAITAAGRGDASAGDVNIGKATQAVSNFNTPVFQALGSILDHEIQLIP